MTRDPHLLLDIAGGLLTLRMNRPEKGNALSPEMMVRLARAWQQFREDGDQRVAILTGVGRRQFCAGADLKLTIPLLAGVRRPADEWDEQLLADPKLATDAVLYGTGLDKPVISALNGDALGGGAELMLATQLRIAAEGVKIGFPEPKRGLVPAGGGIVRLPRYVPYAQAMELLLTADPIEATRAAEIGLINAIAPRERLMDEARALAERVAANAPLSLRAILETVRRTSALSVEDALKLEAEIVRPVVYSKDAEEGQRAFGEKRPPRFSGK